jgi:hypothetical protein
MARAPTRNRKRVHKPFYTAYFAQETHAATVTRCPLNRSAIVFHDELKRALRQASAPCESQASRNRVQGHCPWLVGGDGRLGFDVVPLHRAVHRLDSQHDVAVLKNSHGPG